ncbi:type I polyketide synthase [Polyangium spumosum]|uniref:Acyltransferase domain-containing protein n=1 Tax=Polyangium spumosum TaxID=889282 RepID=A0A6N7Q0D3_9BACT|nr:type I polyketide synthase [Polyangium spumosum]MRG97808.1 acyltransferase domain-containing protein [Polyangium spumosum]
MTIHDHEPVGTYGLSRVKRALLALRASRDKIESLERAKHEPIAIVGMSCRFPAGGADPESFFGALLDGADGVVRIPEERWAVEDLVANKPELRWGAMLEGVDRFDAGFFEISPREASRLDPQQRLLLEVTWEALERAGQRAESLLGSRTGVFVGMNSADYMLVLRDAKAYDAYTLTGNMGSTAAGRVSYTLGLQGPCLTIDTACSSSLVAVHLACQSLRQGESDLAIAAGVIVMLDAAWGVLMAETQALSPDGRCRTFDAKANGFVGGEGCGVVVLKRLSDARRDGDPILAVIRGSAVNQDGRSTGLTAPNVLSQQAMLREALANARVAPEDVGYVETHGTGTSLGDPIEFDALKAVLGVPRANGSRCALGAVKTNIGHLGPAAGMAGLIKAVSCMRHGSIPRNLHFETLNPRISIEGTPFVIPTETLPWERGDKPRIAGVSSFGISGTNAHVVLEEAPRDEVHEGPPAASALLLPLSAKSEQALRDLGRVYHAWLTRGEGRSVELVDLVSTASLRRSHHAVRLSVVGSSKDEIAAALDAFVRDESPPGLVTGKVLPGAPRVVFVFPGQGSQWLGMGRRLLGVEGAFRAALEACDVAIQREAGFSVLAELEADEERSRFAEIDVVQPLLFAIEVGLAALWRSWGVEPAAVVGHSMGEVGAAYVAGALSLEDAARVICRRSRLLRTVSGKGAMALVELPMAECEALLASRTDRLSVAVSNGPRSTVLAGDPAALDEVLAGLEARGVFCRRVKVDVASHSPQMDPLRAELVTALSGIAPARANLPMRSTVTGERLVGDELVAEYWADNLRKPVLFSRVTQELMREGHTIFIEMSPHPILLPAVEENFGATGVEGAVVASLRRQADEQRSLLESLGALHVHGYPLDFRRFGGVGGRVVELPMYPWQKERYWFDTLPARRLPAPAARVSLQGLSPVERVATLERFVQEQISAVVHMDVEALDIRTPLRSLGLDSLMGLEVRRRLEAGLGVRLSATLSWQFADMRELATHLLEKLPAPEADAGAPATAIGTAKAPVSLPLSLDPSVWVRRPCPRPDARVRLFCLPYAGVGASRFRAWPEMVPPWIEVCPIQLPGREDRLREPAFDAMGPLVDALTPMLEGFLDLPFALFGCSVGGLVAFELSRALRARYGVTPRHLFVAACAAPDRANPMQAQLSSLISTDGTGPEAIASLRELGLLTASAVTDTELLAAVWPTMRADLTLALGYRFRVGGLSDAPVTALGGVEDRGVGRGDLGPWYAMTNGAFQLMMMNGGHLFMDTSPRELLEIVCRALRP